MTELSGFQPYRLDVCWCGEGVAVDLVMSFFCLILWFWFPFLRSPCPAIF